MWRVVCGPGAWWVELIRLEFIRIKLSVTLLPSLRWLQIIHPLILGHYEISVKFNEQHIPDSPFLVSVVAPMNDVRRLTVSGLQVRPVSWNFGVRQDFWKPLLETGGLFWWFVCITVLSVTCQSAQVIYCFPGLGSEGKSPSMLYSVFEQSWGEGGGQGLESV